MGKDFEWSFDEQTEAFTSTRRRESIAAEERLDGIYVIRTNLSEESLGDREVVRAYKSLARVDQAFCSPKTMMRRIEGSCSCRMEGRIEVLVARCGNLESARQDPTSRLMLFAVQGQKVWWLVPNRECPPKRCGLACRA